MVSLFIIIIPIIVVLLLSDGTALSVVGKPVDHKKWENILKNHFDKGNYEVFKGTNGWMLVASNKFYNENGSMVDLPFISFSISGIFIDGRISDVGSIYRWSKLNKMIKQEIKKQILNKYQI
jgi:hypothetical protein